MRQPKRGAKKAHDDARQTQIKFGAGGLGLQSGRVLTDRAQTRLPFVAKPKVDAPPTSPNKPEARAKVVVQGGSAAAAADDEKHCVICFGMPAGSIWTACLHDGYMFASVCVCVCVCSGDVQS